MEDSYLIFDSLSGAPVGLKLQYVRPRTLTEVKREFASHFYILVCPMENNEDLEEENNIDMSNCKTGHVS